MQKTSKTGDDSIFAAEDWGLGIGNLQFYVSAHEMSWDIVAMEND